MTNPLPASKTMSRMSREVPMAVFLLSLVAMILGVVWLIDSTMK